MASGVAGLVYEVLWTRYLGLYVGHSAYAQVLVLGVYLGGMAIGAFLVADSSSRLVRPLLWYAAAEGLLALFGVVFHPLFLAATNLSYDVLFPALGNAGLVGSARWAVAGLLILPQAILLGATFPLMATALVRADREHPGRSVANAYLANTVGGAAGVLVAGFWWIGEFGLAGTSVAAAALNLLAAAVAYTHRFGSPGASPAEIARAADVGPDARSDAVPDARRLVALFLTVSFGTALASFSYEIAWIRALSLAVGSATHAFELMLSAFILGLALGAWWIRTRADSSGDAVRLLGIIQVLMGTAALASLPLFYFLSFDVVSWLVATLQGRPAGYALFNLARYGLSLVVMLPATVLAGMTLPIIVGALLRAGAGEASLGRVYGVNTVGSVAGAGFAGLFGLPLLGLKGLLLAGAALDVALGLLLLAVAARGSGRGLREFALGTALAAGAFTAVALGVRLDEQTLTSGTYRYGYVPPEGERLGLYYADGRTATVSAYLDRARGVVTLATNGKPDASLDGRWLTDGRDTLPDRPIEPESDVTTQALAPAIALAHRPQARSVANIGHGSGVSAAAFLSSEAVQRVVTIEIEPLMVQGSLVFMPFNVATFDDPRSSFVFDDAKSYFAYRRELFDIVFAEPSNPWVSGTASLFTEEFYRRVRAVLADDGVLAQWIQIYELRDDLLLSVVAALDGVFPWYRAYLVGDSDLAIVASADGPLSEPDASVLATPGFTALMEGSPPFEPEHLGALLLFDETTLRPLLRRGVTVNSDYAPVLDLEAERARFERASASGTFAFATSRVDLTRALRAERIEPAPYRQVPAQGLAPAVLWGRAAWLREARAQGGGISPIEFPEWQSALVALSTFLGVTRAGAAPRNWPTWAAAFGRTEADLHWGTQGWTDSTFYREVYDFLDRVDAPTAARAAVDLRHAYSRFEWERVSAAADVLVSRVAVGESWIEPETLLDMAVLAHLRTGRPESARTTLTLLSRRSGRGTDDLRLRLLDALVAEAESRGTGP